MAPCDPSELPTRRMAGSRRASWKRNSPLAGGPRGLGKAGTWPRPRRGGARTPRPSNPSLGPSPGSRADALRYLGAMVDSAGLLDEVEGSALRISGIVHDDGGLLLHGPRPRPGR